MWLVTIDGQQSIAPTTAYLPPLITGFSGAGAVNASTDGGELVVISGQYFSTQQFLGTVTYGLGGAQFVARNCSVTVPHTQITCRTVPGTGRALQWVVTVGNQTSQRSAAITSYAIPSLAAAAPANGPTAGGVTITLTGANLGLSYASSVLQVLVNANGAPQPPGFGWYAGLMYAGLPDDGSTVSAAWLASLAPAANFNPVVVSRTVNTLQFVLPVGFGPSAELLVVVDGVPSNMLSFAYNAPVISNLAPDRLNVGAGLLRLTIEGANFCSGTGGCGFVTVNGVDFKAPWVPPAVAPTNWSHTKIVVAVPDPQGAQSTVTVTVGGIVSNAVAFSQPVPAISSLSGQGNWGGAPSTIVSAATVSFGLSLLGSSLTPAAVLSVNVAGPLRAAVADASGRLPVSAVDLVSVTDSATGVVTTVSSNDPANTVNAARRLAGPAGVNLTLSIDAVGAAQAALLSLGPASVAAFTANITAALSRSQMLTAIVERVAKALKLNVSAIRAIIDPASISAPPPTTVTLSAGSALPTRGGSPFWINGVASLFSVAASQISVLLGPFTCLNVSKQQDGDLSADYGVSPFLPDGVTANPLASQFYTYRVTCTTPPGVGAGLPIRISVVGGGTSAADPNFAFSYAAPNITAVVDAGGAAPQSYAYTAASAATAVGATSGFPTVGTAAGAVRLVGNNFGTPALLQQLCQSQQPPSAWATACPASASGALASIFSLAALDAPAARLTDLTQPSAACPACGVASFGFESIVFAMPPGQGARIRLSLTIAGQADTAGQAGDSALPATLVRYLAPVVTGAFNPLTGKMFDPTVGGSLLSISGSNFGTAGFGATPAQGLPVITIGGFDVSVCDASCFPVPPYAPNVATQSVISAILPEGWGGNLPIVVTVEGQSSAPGALYSYSLPQVLSISPALGPTSGLMADGLTPINVTVLGTNLGRIGSLELRPLCFPACLDATSVVIVVPQSAFFVHNHTAMIFAMPEGVGANLLVVAVVGGQDSSSVAPQVLFSYLPPIVERIWSVDPSLKCTPTLALVTASGVGVNASGVVAKLVYPPYEVSCFPTQVDSRLPPKPIHIFGQSFGSSALPISSLSVTIGGRPCPVQSRGHYDIVCSLPDGFGDSNAVILTVGGRTNAATPASTFAYDPPIVAQVQPNRPNAVKGEGIKLLGHNFGGSLMPVTVLIGGQPCLDAAWASDNFVTCATQPDTVGLKNVSVLAANRTVPVFFYEEENGQSLVDFRCPANSMGLRGELCTPCQGFDPTSQSVGVQGANCPGGELDVDLAVSLPGWWRFNSSTALQCASALQEGRIASPNPSWGWAALNPATGLVAVPDPGCPVFVACEPFDSCLGANVCSSNYKGDRCQECATRFYRVNGICIKCPDSPWATVIIFAVLALLALFAAYMLNSKNVNLSLISIGTDWAQVVAMFARTRIAWPALVQQLFLLLSAFNFNLELIAPECAVPGITYSGKWLFVEGMPVFAWACLLLIFATRLGFKLCLGVDKQHRYTHINSLVATGIVVQRVLYLYMTRSTLDVFNCAPSNPPDYDTSGKQIQYMAWNLDIVCNAPGGVHLFLLPFAAFALAIYVVGLPLLSLWFLWRNKEKIKYDQILRAQLTGDDKSTNPHFALRTTFKALYMNYRPGSWAWEFVVCIRKFLIAFCSLMFRATPSFQLAMALLVLFIAYVLQVRTLPYLSHARAVETFREHRLKVAEGNALHVRIHDDMKARAAYYKNAARASARLSAGGTSPSKALAAGAGGGGGSSLLRGLDAGGTGDADLEAFYASKRSRFEAQVLEGRHTILRNRIASFMFDYNTAEAVLLSSALLINLAGICFDSSRFSGTQMQMPGRRAEYDSLAFASIVGIGTAKGGLVWRNLRRAHPHHLAAPTHLRVIAAAVVLSTLSLALSLTLALSRAHPQVIMFLSIIYWFLALGMDLLLVTAPASVEQCLSSVGGAGKLALARAKGAVGRAGAAGAAGAPKRLRVVAGIREDAAPADPNAVSMHTNALMVSQLARGSDGGAGGGGGGGFVSRDLSALPIAAPDEMAWAAIRATVTERDKQRKELAVEVERLRDQLEQATCGGEGGAAASPLRATKKSFAPTAAASGDGGLAKDKLKKRVRASNAPAAVAAANTAI